MEIVLIARYIKNGKETEFNNAYQAERASTKDGQYFECLTRLGSSSRLNASGRNARCYVTVAAWKSKAHFKRKFPNRTQHLQAYESQKREITWLLPQQPFNWHAAILGAFNDSVKERLSKILARFWQSIWVVVAVTVGYFAVRLAWNGALDQNVPGLFDYMNAIITGIVATFVYVIWMPKDN